jgi:acetyl-CoA carboxylase biotin carboxyl carrier protein
MTDADSPDMDDGQDENELAKILAAAGRPPSRIKVRHVTVEVEWPEQGPVAPGETTDRRSGSARPEERRPTVAVSSIEPCAPATAQDVHYLCSPTVGTFYRAPEPGADPFVGEGAVVRPGQQVAIVEVMKLMIPVEADRPGRVLEVLKPDATSVEHGEQLFVLTPDA